MNRQLSFDFNRSAQLRILEDLDLSSATQNHRRIKILLRAIDAAAKGGKTVRVSEARLAQIACCSPRTIRRSLREAIDPLKLVAVTRSEYESTYAIDWCRVIDWNTTPIEPQQPQKPVSNGGWPCEITVEVLTTREHLETLFDHAVSKGWVTEADRLRFLTLAVSVVRRAKAGSIRSVGGAFTQSVKRASTKSAWSWGSESDEIEARAMMADSEKQCEDIRAIAVSTFGWCDVPAQPSRAEQIAALRSRFG